MESSESSTTEVTLPSSSDIQKITDYKWHLKLLFFYFYQKWQLSYSLNIHTQFSLGVLFFTHVFKKDFHKNKEKLIVTIKAWLL